MKKIFTSILLIPITLLIGNSLQAQPTLTESNFMQIGDFFERYNIDASLGIDEQAGGENIEWNFSDLETTSNFSFSVVNPAATANGALFPNANVAANFGNFIDYYEITPNQTDFLGSDVIANAFILQNSNPQTFFTYPFTYNNTFTDTAYRNYLQYVGQVVTNAKADGYGTLKIPTGNFNNVLRISSTIQYRDSSETDPNDFFYLTIEKYEWYSPNERYPLLIIQHRTVNQSGTISTFDVAETKYGIKIDPYGYDFNVLSSPANCEWIDIIPKGKLVQGLADDNIVGPYNLNFDFQYYWTPFNKVYIGSNGYLAFDPALNIASVPNTGFPLVPNPADGTNNFIAPFLADLIHSEPNNPAKVYYWSNNIDSFVVSFINVPFWTNNTPAYTGSNTFQVILNAADSSITYRYKDMATQFAPEYQFGYQNPCVVGFENSTGDYGLEIYNAIPPSYSCINFNPPNIPLIDVIDCYPQYNQNLANGGFFLFKGEIASLSTNIKNGGSVDITSPIAVTGTVYDYNNAIFYPTVSTTINSMATGASQLVTFNEPFVGVDAGSYTYITTANTLNDINPINNTNSVELVVADSLFSGQILLGYNYTESPINSVISWAGGADYKEGCGIYIEPPFYPIDVIGAEFYLLDNAGSTNISNGFRTQLIDDNGPGNQPGTILQTKDAPLQDLIGGTWNTVFFDDTVQIDNGGVYLSWLMEGNGIGIRTDNSPPISRRTYEILAETWSPYRSKNTEDFYIRLVTRKPRGINVSANSLNNNTGFQLSLPIPNPSNKQVSFNYTLPTATNELTFTIKDVLGQTVKTLTANNVSAGNHVLQCNVNNLLPGVYLAILQANNQKAVQKLIVTK